MNEPIKPERIVNTMEIEDTYVNASIDYINQILTLPASISALANGRSVSIWDSSDSEMWLVGHKRAIAKFIEAGWSVVPAEQPYVYLFQIYPTAGSRS